MLTRRLATTQPRVALVALSSREKPAQWLAWNHRDPTPYRVKWTRLPPRLAGASCVGTKNFWALTKAQLVNECQEQKGGANKNGTNLSEKPLVVALASVGMTVVVRASRLPIQCHRTWPICRRDARTTKVNLMDPGIVPTGRSSASGCSS